MSNKQRINNSQLDRLLSGRRSHSISEKEEILDKVFSQCSLSEHNHSSTFLRIRILKPISAVAALLLVLGIPTVIYLRSGSINQSEFTPRGAQKTIKPSMLLGCIDPQTQSSNKRSEKIQCNTGNKLFFRVSANSTYRFFASFSSGDNGRAIWYFPGGNLNHSIPIAHGEDSGVLERGVIIGPEHSRGTYTVFGVFSSKALDKSQIRRLIDSEESIDIKTIIIKRIIRVEP